MRRRSSGSTEEDEPEEDIGPQAKPIRAEDVGENKITSSVEPLVSTRHSETLDRRKTDKALAYTQSAQDEAFDTRRFSFGDTARGKSKVERPTVTATAETMNEHLMYRRARVRSPWSISSLTVGVTVLSIVLLYAIVNSFLNLQRDPKGCNNCWMSPAYAKLSGFDTEHTRFASKYSLYLYREGGVDEDTMVAFSLIPSKAPLMSTRSKAYLYYSSLGTLEATSKSAPSRPKLRTIFKTMCRAMPR